ncbi:Acg family FMN-binding oxidoreductase [Streptomyces sp. MUM 178J]|uniref:Acg family FMN-binding oxidoreductase n=1 Tax=Streptomyces sp. MUM 178J TaxID=2791991 RepID=UPI001F03DC99|nr:nitroreductase family protein [Streptomyces sp. MUM 178J]WRQ78155.1 nitroreductase [Streptomyces sp. MUM 178J]
MSSPSVPSLDEALVTALVADAVRAPSMHNAQPWRFRFLRRSGVVQLRADPQRAMPRSDPDHRGLHLGCGAALFNLRTAAAHAGFEPETELLPDPADPWLAAEVRLVRPVRAEGDDAAALYPAIRRRHTSRLPFTDEEIPEALLDGLSGCAVREGARLVFPDPWHVRSVLDLVHDAEGREAADPAKREETARWVRTEAAEGGERAEGIPAYALGPRQWDVTSPVRDFAGRRPTPGRASAVFEKAPCLGLLGTAGDARADWLRAGQAMERVLLQATLDGLVASLTSQALEWPELRWAVRDPQSAMGHVHMVLRLGYGPQGPETPRRPVSEMLDVM